MSTSIHEFIDMESGETIYVEMTQEQFMDWLHKFCATLGPSDMDEDEETYPVVSVICDKTTSSVLAACAPQDAQQEMDRVRRETGLEVEVLPAYDLGEGYYQLLTSYSSEVEL